MILKHFLDIRRINQIPAIILVLAVVLLFPLSAQEKYDSRDYFPQTNKVLVGAEYGYPPYSIVNEDSEVDGFSVQLIRAALKSMGYQAEFVTGPWSEVKKYPVKGIAQALPLVRRTPELEGIYDLTFTYLTMHGTIIVREDEKEIHGLDDLAEKQIAVMKGGYAEEFIRRGNLNAEIITTGTFEEAVTNLSAGMYDAVIIQKLMAYQLMNQLGITNLKVACQPLESFVHNFSFAVRDGESDLLAILNEGLSIVIADGTFRKLYAEWFGPIELKAKQFDRIIVGGDHNYPPYEFLDENGQPTGYNVELTHAIAKQMGLFVEIVLAPWADILGGLGDQTIDIIHGIFYSAVRDEYIDFSQPHTVINHVIVTRKGEAVYNTLKDLSGSSKILVMESDIMHNIVIDFGYEDQVITASSQKEVLQLLSEGTADCALVAQIPAYYWIEQNGWNNLQVGDSAIISPEYSYGTLEEHDDLLMIFSEGLAAIKSSGEYRRIYEKWLGVYEDTAPGFRETIRIILFVAIPLLVVGISALFWSWTLRGQVKKQTRKIREQRDLLERVMETSPVGITVINSNGYFSFVNPVAEQILGVPRDVIIQRTFDDPRWEITDIENQPIAYEDQPFSRTIQRKDAVFDARQWITRQDGTRRLLSINSSPLIGESGSVAGVVTALADITEHYLADAEVEKEKEQLAVTLQSIGDGVITTDTKGKILIMNRVAENLTGWSQKEAAGKPFATVFIVEHQYTRNPVEDPIEKVLSTGKIMELPGRILLISRDGTERIIAVCCAPIKDSKEKIIGVVLVFRDLTEEQKLLDYLQRTTKLDSLGVLAGGIAHDFNNLLSGLFGFIEMAKTVGGDADMVRTYLDEALTAFSRAKDLTMQLLTFSRGGAPIRTNGSLKSLIQKSTTFTLSGSNSSCVYHIADDLWLCEFDENQMGQVLDNIIINAQQAMPHGGEITISASNLQLQERRKIPLEPGDYILLSIRDVGTGISPEHLKKVFDPFFTTKEKGNGLGLATCYSIVKKHDGIIDVESRLGIGTVFTIYLPRSTSGSDEVLTEENPKSDHTGNGVIVIMDDEAIIRQVVGSMVKSMGYDVIEARDGGEVLELCGKFHDSNNPVKAALFDLTIPGGIGGKETVVECRKKFPDIPIFASSGYSTDPVMADPEKYGFTASISKPYRKQGLAALFSKYIKK